MVARTAVIIEPDPIEFQIRLEGVAASLEMTSIPLAAAASFVREDIQTRFQTKTGPDGTPWQPWAESYEERAEAFPNIGMLRRTDEMYSSLVAENAFIVSADTLFYSPSAPERAEWHQEGRPTRRTRSGSPNPLPQREMIGPSPVTQTLIFSTFKEWFDRAIDLFQTSTGRVGLRHAMRGSAGTFVPRTTPLPFRPRAPRI